MAWQGSEAFEWYEPYEVAEERAAKLVSHEGGHLDADARRGVSADFIHRIVAVVFVAVCLFAVGSASVALSAETVRLKQDNATVSSHIQEMELTNDDLRIECSKLARFERIERIATQNLGMEYATEAELLQMG